MTRSAITLAFVVGATLSGCGAGGRHHRPEPPHRAGLEPSFRWLVPITGAQPSVEVENRRAGTRAWRLPGPAAEVGGVARGSVIGYVAEQALAPGEIQRIYVSAPRARRATIDVFRIGWYGGAGGRQVLASRPLRVVRQPLCTHRLQTGLTECRWHPTLSFRIPAALASGVYIAKLTAGRGLSDCLFVVRASDPQPLLAQLPTATYEAYNAWGGDSLYPGGADRVGLSRSTQGLEVSYDRPYDSITGAGQFFARDVAMVRYLERYGYPVSYTTSESVDQDPGQLSGHRALIDFGHSEYWSARQMAAFARARDTGTSLLFFGSDTSAWRVRYAAATAAGSEAGRPGHTIIAYKQFAAGDPDRSNPSRVFVDRGAALAGSAYLGCITPRLRRPGPPVYRYYSWSPDPARRPSWLFAGTGVTVATRIPGIVGYELDERTSLSPPRAHVVGTGTAPCMALIEPGQPIAGNEVGLAESTLYTAPSGALVFNTGTLGWELGLEPVPSASPDAPLSPDHRVVAMTNNLLRKVLAPGAEPVGR